MIRIKRDSPQGNIHNILAVLERYKRRLNRERISTPLIDSFFENKAWMNMEYDEVCAKVSRLSHGFIKII